FHVSRRDAQSLCRQNGSVPATTIASTIGPLQGPSSYQRATDRKRPGTLVFPAEMVVQGAKVLRELAISVPRGSTGFSTGDSPSPEGLSASCHTWHIPCVVPD